MRWYHLCVPTPFPERGHRLRWLWTSRAGAPAWYSSIVWGRSTYLKKTWPSSSSLRFLAGLPSSVMPHVPTTVWTQRSCQPRAIKSTSSSVAVAAIQLPRSAGQRRLSAASGYFLWAVLTGPMKWRPRFLSWTAVLTELNQESPTTILPLPCHGWVSRRVVDVVAPWVECQRFLAFRSFPSLSSMPIMIPDSASAMVFASQPTPFGLRFILITLGNPPGRSHLPYQANMLSSTVIL